MSEIEKFHQPELPYPQTVAEATEAVHRAALETNSLDSAGSVASVISNLQRTGLAASEQLKVVDRLKVLGIPVDVSNIRRGMILRQIKKTRSTQQLSISSRLQRAPAVPRCDDLFEPQHQHFDK